MGTKGRVIWCPEDCEADYKDKYEEAACHGPQKSGCVLWVKPKQTVELLKIWYGYRNKFDNRATGFKDALLKCREHNMYEVMLFEDVSKDIGHENSKFLATYSHHHQAKVTTRDKITAALKKYPKLGDILNKFGQHKPGQDEL